MRFTDTYYILYYIYNVPPLPRYIRVVFFLPYQGGWRGEGVRVEGQEGVWDHGLGMTERTCRRF